MRQSDLFDRRSCAGGCVPEGDKNRKWTGTESAGPELQNYNFLGYAFTAFFLPSLTLSSLTRSSCSDSGAKARKQRRAFSESSPGSLRFVPHAHGSEVRSSLPL